MSSGTDSKEGPRPVPVRAYSNVADAPAQSALHATSMSSSKPQLALKLAQARLNRIRREEELRLRLEKLESERLLARAEADVVEASIIADDDFSDSGSVLHFEESVSIVREAKIDAFLKTIENHVPAEDVVEKQFLQPKHTAPSSALKPPPGFSLPVHPSMMTAVSSPSFKADANPPPPSRLTLGPVPSQLFNGPATSREPQSANAQSATAYPEEFSEPAATSKRGNSAYQPGGESLFVNDVAKLLARCQGSGPISELDKFCGDPLDYFKFIRKVEDRILSIYGNSDPGHALHLLLEATSGRAHKLISSCVMLSPEKGLQEALQLLHKTFGSSQVAVRSYINSVCNGGPIPNTEAGLQDFYSDLVNCKVVLEAVGAHNLLNAASTAEQIFMRLPLGLQKGFAKLAADRGFDMDYVPFDLFLEFVDSEHKLICSRFGRLMQPKYEKPTTRFRPGVKMKVNLMQSAADVKSVICSFCKSAHHIFRCENFLQIPVKERKSFVKQKNLCFNCLREGHGARNCPSKSRCRTCSGSHHTLLHHSPENRAELNRSPIPSPPDSAASSAVSASSTTRSKTRLQVLPVCVINHASGICKDTFALLDSGADCHLIAKDLYDALGLCGRPIVSELQLANGYIEKHETFSVECAVRGAAETEMFMLEGVRMVPQMPNLSGSIPSDMDVMENPHLAGLEFPDVEGRGRVQLIIGISSPGLHVFSEIRQAGDASLWAGKTPLGWVLHGPSAGVNDSCCRVNLLVDRQASRALKVACPCQFEYGKEVEDPEGLCPSLDDELAETTMKDSCEYVNGHYQIQIPWKEGCPCLPNNYEMALSRLNSLGRRLVKDNELFLKYRDKIRELISLGHAVPVRPGDEIDGRTWYIPHHCTKGKFRVVFDCASEYGGTSLNKQILQGPDNANNLIGVLTRFRSHEVAFVGDIRAMFHSVKVPPCDQPALRFLWWENDDMSLPPKTFQLTVHCFGLTSSPSVAGFALRRTADENRSNSSPEAVQTVKRNMYVDDLLKSACDGETAIGLINDIVLLLKSGGFELLKFSSNSLEILKSLPPDSLAPHLREVDLHKGELPGQKTLGLVWLPQTDEFAVRVNSVTCPFTRRGLLSLVMSVYDPLGVVAPFLLPLKSTMQHLTKLGLGWDSEISSADKAACEKLLKALPNLNDIAIPRRFISADFRSVLYSAQLHVFADASVTGIGVACYLRMCFDNEYFAVSFLLGKSRVAPVKMMTIPRLELCAALVAARLAKFLEREIDLNIEKTVLWSDSTVVLSYLRDTSKRRPIFETNRIRLIRQYFPVENWRWVNTESNPADVFSRGVSPTQPIKAKRWLEGPAFLLEKEENWPSRESPKEVASPGDITATVATNALPPPGNDVDFSLKDGALGKVIDRCSTLRHAVRNAAWLLRLKYNLRERVAGNLPKLDNFISVEEYDSALLALISLAQRQDFPGLIEALDSKPYFKIAAGDLGHELKDQIKPLVKYCPFVKNRVMRLGGRLQRSNEPYDFKHPIVLPRDSHLTVLIVDHIHRRSGHNGVSYVMNELREKYYVVGQERTVKRIINTQCMGCRNRRAGPGAQIMSPLPPARVEAGERVFTATGVDFMGPVLIKAGRNNLKRYCCVFTCLASRASHLEVAFDLTTGSFLMALRRFLAVRGTSTKTIYCDNATNFIGAESELKRGLERLKRKEIVDDMCSRGIQFRHSPPLASHQGGVWEAIIRLVRKSMAALQADRYYRTLTDEELLTLFKEIEYILNTRPLTRVSANPDDYRALSPMTLLNGCIDPERPSDIFSNSDGLRRSYRASQMQADLFWKRWRLEYLTFLQKRHKWVVPHGNIQPNSLVLVKDDQAPRCSWPKAVVTSTILDRDQVCRRAVIRTADGKMLTRDIRKLCVLEGDV